MKLVLLAVRSLLLMSLITGCSAEDKKTLPEQEPGSGDQAPEPKIPDGFNVLTPNYLGFKVYDNELSLDEFVSGQCAGQAAGAFFSMESYAEKQELRFCLDFFARPESDTFETICLDCKEKINISNVYVGIVTDKSQKGVADISFITIVETADFIRTNCEATTFGDTMKASYGNNTVSKAVLEQWLSLQLDDGVCNSVKLDNYQDLLNVTMTDWNYDTNIERAARFALTRIDLQGRE